MNILVFTTCYPNKYNKQFGIFVKERMKRVEKYCNIIVVSPVSWFFLLKNYLKQSKRTSGKTFVDEQNTIRPIFFYIPGFFPFLNGIFLYVSSLLSVLLIKRKFKFDIIDAHFAYPDGFAAVLLAKTFRVPVVITLRGTINHYIKDRYIRKILRYTFDNATKIFSVSSYLSKIALSLGIESKKIKTIPNGVDIAKFKPCDRAQLRANQGISNDRKIIISVGALCERKGQYRVLEILPEIKKDYPDLLYIIVGGASVEGDMTEELQNKIKELNLVSNVMITGEVKSKDVNTYLNIADIFVLSTRFEGWPNVFMEAMACGLPVVTTDICGNSEIIQDGKTGLLVPFGNSFALSDAIKRALSKKWDSDLIKRFSRERPWEKVADEVYSEFLEIKK